MDTAGETEPIVARILETSRAIEAAVPATPALPVPDFGKIADGVINATDDVAYGLRSIADAFAASMDALGEATYHNLLRTLQIAATSACLTAMLAQPEKAASYEEVLAAIKRVG